MRLDVPTYLAKQLVLTSDKLNGLLGVAARDFGGGRPLHLQPSAGSANAEKMQSFWNGSGIDSRLIASELSEYMSLFQNRSPQFAALPPAIQARFDDALTGADSVARRMYDGMDDPSTMADMQRFQRFGSDVAAAVRGLAA